MTEQLSASQLGLSAGPRRPNSAFGGSNYNPRNMQRSFLDDIVEGASGPGAGSYNVQRSYKMLYAKPAFSIQERHPEGGLAQNPGPNYYHPKSQQALTHGIMAESQRDALFTSRTPTNVGPNSYTVKRPAGDHNKSLGVKTDYGDQVGDYIRNHPSGVGPNSYLINSGRDFTKHVDPKFSMGVRTNTTGSFVGPSCQDYRINRSLVDPGKPAFSFKEQQGSVILLNTPAANAYRPARPQSGLGNSFGGRYKGQTF